MLTVFLLQVIIFSQFVKMLDLLDDYLELRGWQRFRLDGQAEYKADQDDIREFNTAECTEDCQCSAHLGRLP